jgi:hypothetical protein
MSRPTFEQLLAGEVQVSLLNEPIDYTVNFTVPSAIERAKQRWRCTEVISGDRCERE